jgi:hypothetical protein
LGNEQITAAMDKILSGFNFDKVESAIKNLVH